VIFLGEMQPHEIAPYYHACQVFVLPSIARSEAFGIVQLEAMACGKPVVNTKIASGVPYVSLDGITGITVLPASPEALAAAVNRLLDDHHLRAQYGVAAQKRVETEFSQQVMVRAMQDVYAEVLGPASLAHRHPPPAVLANCTNITNITKPESAVSRVVRLEDCRDAATYFSISIFPLSRS